MPHYLFFKLRRNSLNGWTLYMYKLNECFIWDYGMLLLNWYIQHLCLQVQLPNLKTLNLYQVNFEKIWHHQLPIMSPCFQNLTNLSVWSCRNLKHLFSSSTLGSFEQLQDLCIEDCKALEAIIRIDELGNNVEHPSLKKLRIEGCPVKEFIFNDKVGKIF